MSLGCVYFCGFISKLGDSWRSGDPFLGSGCRSRTRCLIQRGRRRTRWCPLPRPLPSILARTLSAVDAVFQQQQIWSGERRTESGEWRAENLEPRSESREPSTERRERTDGGLAVEAECDRLAALQVSGKDDPPVVFMEPMDGVKWWRCGHPKHPRPAHALAAAAATPKHPVDSADSKIPPGARRVSEHVALPPFGLHLRQ